MTIGQGERDKGLAIGDFAQGAAVLVSHTNTGLSTLGQRGVVDDQHRVFTAT